MSISSPLDLNAIREAHARIRGVVRRTPVVTSSVLDAQVDANLFFKCENFQKVGAFKARGAANAVLSLTDAAAVRGVVTHSSGNHAAALARAARLRGIKAFVVMPLNAPQAKQAAVRRYGGEIIFCEPTLPARDRVARQVVQETGGVFIHAYDDPRVMAGQGTVALELLEQVPELDAIVCPVGGGGLLSGVAAAAKALKPDIRIIAAEPAGADDAARSFRERTLIHLEKPASIADGLLTSLSERTFAEMQRYVDDIVTVSEQQIVQAMRQIWEVLKIVVEPSGAVAYAALREQAAQLNGQRIGIIVSGGNLDLDMLPWQRQS